MVTEVVAIYQEMPPPHSIGEPSHGNLAQVTRIIIQENTFFDNVGHNSAPMAPLELSCGLSILMFSPVSISDHGEAR